MLPPPPNKKEAIGNRQARVSEPAEADGRVFSLPVPQQPSPVPGRALPSLCAHDFLQSQSEDWFNSKGWWLPPRMRSLCPFLDDKAQVSH